MVLFSCLLLIFLNSVASWILSCVCQNRSSFIFTFPLSSCVILTFWLLFQCIADVALAELFLSCVFSWAVFSGALRSGAQMLVCCFGLTALSDTVNIPCSWALVGLRVEVAERWRNISHGLFSVTGLMVFSLGRWEEILHLNSTLASLQLQEKVIIPYLVVTIHPYMLAEPKEYTFWSKKFLLRIDYIHYKSLTCFFFMQSKNWKFFLLFLLNCGFLLTFYSLHAS